MAIFLCGKTAFAQTGQLNYICRCAATAHTILSVDYHEEKMKNFYIEYKIGKEERHKKLEALFARIKLEKEKYHETKVEPQTEIRNWEKYLDKEAKKWFNNIIPKPNSKEKIFYDKLWNLTKPEIRIEHPIFNTGGSWDFESMLYAIFEGDYELIEIEKSVEGGTLFYKPYGAPFGGTESLVELIESFGNKVTYDFWHEGPHLRAEIGWDYELAKKLVEQGKGIEYVYKTKKAHIKENQSNKKYWWKFWT